MNQAETRKNLILDFIGKNESVSNRDIIEYLGQSNIAPSRVTVERDIDEFITAGLVQQIGAGRSVRYQKAEQETVVIVVEEKADIY